MKCLLCYLFGHKNITYTISIAKTKKFIEQDIELMTCSRCYLVSNPFKEHLRNET